MKKLILILAFLLFASPAMATDYVLMALQVQTTGEGVKYFQLVNGTQTHNVAASQSHTLAQAGGWDMVLFQLETIKPDGMTKLEAAEWLANADGFLGFDYRMLYEGERLGAAITNRTFDYGTVLNNVIRMEWWTESGGEYTRHSGTRADWASAGWPKMCRVLPMPHYLGRPNDTY